MKCVSALSTANDPESALAEVLSRAEGEAADLAVLFASRHHAGTLATTARELRTRGLAQHVIGCTGESIVGDGQEIEDAPALSLWTLRSPNVELRGRRLTEQDHAPGDEFLNATNPSLLLLGDPFSFPAEDLLKSINAANRPIPVFGGMASGSHRPGGNRLVLDDEVFEDGAVAFEIGGPISSRTVVSQGCRPIGRPLIVTRIEGHVIRELGRRPAIEVLREVYETLSPRDQERVRNGLHVGRVINEYQESFGMGDFLIRNVMGGDEGGGIAVGDHIRVGQTVQFHVRDHETASDELRGLLENVANSRGESEIAGALLFTCNGRGTRLFPGLHHDVGLIQDVLGRIPVGGFFAMGELGAVGGQNFVHGFTASIVLFGDTPTTSSEIPS
ncbi:FIST signal transduction protein [Singulisphaera rosea]